VGANPSGGPLECQDQEGNHGTRKKGKIYKSRVAWLKYENVFQKDHENILKKAAG
jgi:hypothetical protein